MWRQSKVLPKVAFPQHRKWDQELSVFSPCIDKGLNLDANHTVPTVDMWGHPRPIDILDEFSPDYLYYHNPDAFCDMGASEVQGPKEE